MIASDALRQALQTLLSAYRNTHTGCLSAHRMTLAWGELGSYDSRCPKCRETDALLARVSTPPAVPGPEKE